MPKKLKLALAGLTGSILPLALKSVALGVLLYLALATGNWFFIAVFAVAGCYFYFVPGVNYAQFLASLLVILALPAFLYSVLYPSYFFLASCMIAMAFFALLGVKNLIFINRQPIYSLLNGVLILAVFSLFFWSDRTDIFFFVKYLLAFSAFFFLFKEFLGVMAYELNEQKKKMFVWTISFLVFQIVWALNFLPLDFLNAGAMALLIVLILEDFVSHHLSGNINKRMVLRNITIFIVLSIAIFGASKWSL